MRHLHVRFIAAGLGLGIGIVMLAAATWHAWLWSQVDGFILRAFIVTVLYALTGLTIVIYSWQEVIREMKFHAHRH